MTTRKQPRHPAPLGRRQFLIRSGLFGAAGLSLPTILAACGGDDSDSTADTGGGTGTTAAGGATGTTAAAGGGGGQLYFENWPEYIDGETVAAFTADTGINLKYTEAFNDNNEYFAKILPILSKGDTIDPDVLAPTFWLAARMIGLDWVQKLPLDQIPNAKNLRTALQNPTWDPTGEYTLPWQTGMTGIAYNKAAAGRALGSVEDLFDPALKGKVGMLTEMRDTIGLILLGQGIEPATADTYEKAAPAFDQLQQATADGQIRQFTGNDYIDDLVQGNFAACIGWSGDVLQLSLENPDVGFAIPEEGGMQWADCMVLMKGSPNAEAAATWMNYVYDPANAARITAEVQYVSPVEGVREELEKVGGDTAALAESPLLFPDDETSSRLHGFANLSEEEEAKFDARFSEITGA